jgi:hypothetical protein
MAPEHSAVAGVCSLDRYHELWFQWKKARGEITELSDDIREMALKPVQP